MPIKRTDNTQRLLLLGVALIGLGLAGCNNEQPAARQQPQAQVSVVVLHPQSVAVTAELPGRVSASLIAEVRPQVGGIIKSRVFREGSEVKAGELLYEIEPATYQAAFDSAVAVQQKAEAAAVNARLRADRYIELLQRNAASQQDTDDAKATLAQAVADVAAAKASVETARINLDFTKVTAPIGGRVDRSTLTAGALVTANQAAALTTIRQLEPINVDVVQSSINLLNFRQAVAEGRLKLVGNNVAVRLKLDTGLEYKLPGRIEFADTSIDVTTGTFGVRAEFPNPDRLLLPGMFVRAVIEEGIAQNSFLLPQRAVSRNPKGEATAKFVDSDGKVEERVFVTERNIGNNWLVNQDVKNGDRIIVEGGQLVRPGQTVTATEVTIDEATGEIRPVNRQASLGPSPGAALTVKN